MSKEFDKVLGMILKDKSLSAQFMQNPQATLKKYGIDVNAATAQNISDQVETLRNKGMTPDQIVTGINFEGRPRHQGVM